MLKQVKRELAEEAAAKKAAAPAVKTINGAVSQEGLPKKNKESKALKPPAASLQEAGKSDQLQNGQPKSKKATAVAGLASKNKTGDKSSKQMDAKSKHLKKRK